MNLYFTRIANLVWIIWVASWWAAALWRNRSTKKAPSGSYRWHLAMVAIGFALLFAPWGRFAPLWTIDSATGWLLVAAVAAGAAFAWWARIHLGKLWSGNIETRENHRVVDSGPYALVRHPIYTGLIVSAFALAAIRATPLPFVGALLFALGFALKAKVEERFLAAELPLYAQYAKRVPMLVPGLRFG